MPAWEEADAYLWYAAVNIYYVDKRSDILDKASLGYRYCGHPMRTTGSLT